VKVRATKSCRWRPQRFEYSQGGVDGFAVESTLLEVGVQGVRNGTGCSNCQGECESAEKMHCESWFVASFVGEGRAGGFFDSYMYAEFSMDYQDSLSSMIYQSTSVGIRCLDPACQTTALHGLVQNHAMPRVSNLPAEVKT
jgi:hypothetical protein